MSLPRLCAATPVTGPAALPGYQPDSHGTGIVHLGLGAFHRAHQAAITDAALAAAGGDWRILSVALRRHDLADRLTEQDGRFTLIERTSEGDRTRVIAAIAGAIGADPAAALRALIRPETRIVTLTVTEKAYGIDRATGGIDPMHPAVEADLADPVHPSGVLGLLVAALRRRRAEGQPPPAILCCDNLPENGVLLRGGVADFARRAGDAGLSDWITAEVPFPSTMVDRITPAPTDRTLADAAAATGCTDLAAVETEPFLDWVIENDFPRGRPAWEAGGALFVPDVAAFEMLKLRMLNGAHSLIAYAGGGAGYRLVRDAMDDIALVAVVRALWTATARTLPTTPGRDPAEYARSLEARFANPAIAHATAQIAMDGTQKLPQRLLVPAAEAMARGLPIDPFAFAVAAWMHHCVTAPTDDPRADEIAAALAGRPRTASTIADALLALAGLFPPVLVAHPGWRASVEGCLSRMLDQGMAPAIRAEAGRTDR